MVEIEIGLLFLDRSLKAKTFGTYQIIKTIKQSKGDV
jgi:hypothetical protein